jgi:hypothetical protein
LTQPPLYRRHIEHHGHEVLVALDADAPLAARVVAPLLIHQDDGVVLGDRQAHGLGGLRGRGQGKRKNHEGGRFHGASFRGVAPRYAV